MNNTGSDRKTSPFKRILAICGIAILAGMYIVSLIASFFNSEFAHSLFIASLYCSFIIPVVIYVAIRLSDMLNDRK